MKMIQNIKNIQIIFFQILLLEALKGNRCNYVRVLLDQGVDLKMINFAELYEQVGLIYVHA